MSRESAFGLVDLAFVSGLATISILVFGDGGAASTAELSSVALAPAEFVVTSVQVTTEALSGIMPLLLVCAGGVVAIQATKVASALIPKPYPTRTFGQFRRVVETETVIEECVNCGLEGYDGVERDARKETVVAGRVLRTDASTVVSECAACHEADLVEYGLRAEAPDPAPPGAADTWGEDDQQDSTDSDSRLTRIKHVGDSLAENLRDKGFETVADVREADRDELTAVTGVGEQRARDMQLGARHVGLELGVDLARRLDRAGFETAADVHAASLDELTEVRGVGRATARKIQHAVPDGDETVEVAA